MLIDFVGIRRRLPLLAVLVAVGLAAAACGDSSSDDDAASTSSGATEGPGASESGALRLGYFANVTHAPAVIGEEEGMFAASLGEGVQVEYVYFNSGTEAIEALFSGAIDASFIGPNPAINGFAQSGGEALRIVAGTTSGGASLVVREGIDSPEDLAGTTLATPSLGNTQDVALRAWLTEHGYAADVTGGGDVSIRPQANADTLTTFREGAIDGAWVPEPWATRLELEGGGKVLVDERDVWPDGQFVTTHLIVDTDYLGANPQVVRALITGLLEAIDVANEDPARARAATNAGIERITTKALPESTIAGAWERLTFTADPIASSLAKSKDDAVAAGLLDEVDLADIYDLTILNELLAERGNTGVGGL
ncbi:MAG: aliphatic sulfonate ABC transporter substrate-binding protein [Acidimicrobiia bacterium]|nr:aliphatic sulfonate ABC transporter substrate-binding protein [Acidimicrobiia bacterium]